MCYGTVARREGGNDGNSKVVVHRKWRLTVLVVVSMILGILVSFSYDTGTFVDRICTITKSGPINVISSIKFKCTLVFSSRIAVTAKPVYGSEKKGKKERRKK